MKVRYRSYVDLIPVFLCVLMLGAGGFFAAINYIPLPSSAQVSPIKPALPSLPDTTKPVEPSTPTPTTPPPKVDETEPTPIPTITVTPTEPTPEIPLITIAGISPISGEPGTVVVVNGSGFNPYATAKVIFDSKEVAAVQTDGYGIFVVVFEVPVVPPGIYDITVTDGVKHQTIEFTVVVMPSVPAPAPTLTTQHIETRMQGVSILQISYMNYTNYLQAGDVIDGIVSLTGPSRTTDNSYTWTFQILGPGGESIKVLNGDFRTTSSLQFHVPVSYAGTYRIRVTHQSIYTKTLTIDLTPPGWGYADLK